MFCVTPISMTPGWLCRNFPENESSFFSDEKFQAFSQERALLDSRFVALTKAASELTVFCRIPDQQNTIYWVGRYFYALEPVHQRDGYFGAGLWIVNGLAEPDKLTKLLDHLCDRTRNLMQQNTANQIDFARFKWAQAEVDSRLIEETVHSIRSVEPAFAPDVFSKIVNCYIDASREGRPYSSAALLRFAQTSGLISKYERIFISKSRETALRQNVSNIAIMEISNLPDSEKNALLEDSEEDIQNAEAITSDVVASANPREEVVRKQFDGLAKSTKSMSTIDVDGAASQLEMALQKRLPSVEQVVAELRHSHWKLGRETKLLHITTIVAALTSLTSLGLSTATLVRGQAIVNEGSIPQHDAAPLVNTDVGPSQPVAEQPKSTQTNAVNDLRIEIATAFDTNLGNVAEIKKLLRPQDCQKSPSSANSAGSVLAICAKQMTLIAKNVDTLYNSLTQLADKVKSATNSAFKAEPPTKHPDSDR